MVKSAQQLAEALGQLLLRRQLQVTTAESCTGGLIAAAITDISGSSGWFEAGYVTYSNAAKTKMLGVPLCLISEKGAVSVEVAEAMAEGARQQSGADWAVAVSGVAGPGGGTPNKPVGMVCFAWSGPLGVSHDIQYFAGERAAVRRQTVCHALQVLISRIEEEV